MNNKVKIMKAENSGMCFGVKRAIKLAREAAKKSDSSVYTLGAIIHNPQAVEVLKRRNIFPIDSILQLENKDTVILRSHGVPQYVWEELVKKGVNIVDATCPFVKKAQRIVSDLAKQRKRTLIIGDKNHPEVIGIKSYAEKNAIIVNSIKELKTKDLPENLSIISQTTQPFNKIDTVVEYLESRGIKSIIYNTICDATMKRQEEAYDIANKVDLVIVIGGKNSSNTRRLFEICKEVKKDTIHIEDEKEVDISLFNKKNIIGIVTGASTPSWIIRKVITKLRRLLNYD
ncbi:4-hydroxy-3-methylbut-2-enyl diphosphate reductase [bacterium]